MNGVIRDVIYVVTGIVLGLLADANGILLYLFLFYILLIVILLIIPFKNEANEVQK